MTVKSLSYLDKVEIANLHLEKTHKQIDIAKTFNVSERTIRRVLRELGIESSRQHISNQNKAYLDIIRRYGVSTSTLDKALAAYLTPVNYAENVLSEHNAMQVAQMVLRRFLKKANVKPKLIALTNTEANAQTHQ